MELTMYKKRARLGMALVAPSLLLILLLIVYPIFYNLYLSFFDIAIDQTKEFVGLSNYIQILSDPDYWSALLTTVIFLLGSVTGTTVLGVLVAVLLNESFRGKKVVSIIALLPYFVPVISVVFAWRFAFDPVIGLFNQYLFHQWHILSAPININDPKNGLIIVIIFDIWKHFPLATMLILARLQSINKDYYEAAALDGCGPIKRFFYVTIPEIYFILGTVVLLRFIWNFNQFDTVFLMSSSVNTIPVYTYKTAFLGTFEQGIASSITVVQLLMLALLIWFYVKQVLKW